MDFLTVAIYVFRFLKQPTLPTILNRRVLAVALFIHDIAKGRPEDHSEAGARIARKLGPRFGLDEAETDTVSWLVEHHLLMSTVAQSRDLSDPRTIETFSGTVITGRATLLTVPAATATGLAGR